YFLTWQPWAFEIGVGTRANAREGLRKLNQPPELHFVARLAPLRVIAILLPASRIAAGRLKMTVRAGADPHVGPRWRNGKSADAFELDAIADRMVRRVNISKTACGTDPPNARHRASVDVPQARDLCRFHGIDERRG